MVILYTFINISSRVTPSSCFLQGPLFQWSWDWLHYYYYYFYYYYYYYYYYYC